MSFLQSARSFPVGKQQHPLRFSAFSHDSANQPPSSGLASCAFDSSTAFFQSASFANFGAARCIARQSPWLFGAQAYEPPYPTQQHPAAPAAGCADATPLVASTSPTIAATIRVSVLPSPPSRP